MPIQVEITYGFEFTDAEITKAIVDHIAYETGAPAKVLLMPAADFEAACIAHLADCDGAEYAEDEIEEWKQGRDRLGVNRGCGDSAFERVGLEADSQQIQYFLSCGGDIEDDEGFLAHLIEEAQV